MSGGTFCGGTVFTMTPVLNKLPWNRATTAAFQLSEGFVRFLSWGTSFTGGGGGQYLLVNNVRGDR